MHVFCFARLPVVQTDLRARSQRILAASTYVNLSRRTRLFFITALSGDQNYHLMEYARASMHAENARLNLSLPC